MSKSLESVIKEELGLSVLKSVGIGGGGCISEGSAYETDKYGRVYIKVNSKSGARTMFEGEYASLEALGKPDIVRVPKPYKVVDQPGGGAALVMEYIQFSGGLSKYSALLGQQLARLHLHNSTLEKKAKKAEGHLHKDETSEEYISQFGFHVNTCCGYIEMDNTWKDDWPSFYAEKIERHISMIEKKDGDRKARELWNKILVKFSSFFEGLNIKPAIIHGDLWGGNVSETDDGPLIFDPATFYGHSEYDLGISYLFGGFNSKFYGAYHDVIPKAPGFQKRKELYKAFHYLNHWNHFGGGYRGSSISTLQACVNSVYN
ncbi:ketosamine-3-kinase-like [Mercenaria mercenaria]|uniref:ketosamine-3-kinase-like n=1 Tax=Mercenaria mercenaria TaxID=6596 RepID=UPI00234F5601|nr:ketosamine-3-kinase-like [Mercenaria mercenaria]